MKINKKGFTLLELLVVVLIIGILAGIALPQYKKATEKAKAAQAIIFLRAVYKEAQMYFITNGGWPSSFSKLNMESNLSSDEWTVNVHSGQASGDRGFNHFVAVTRSKGPYAGTSFMIYQDMDKLYKPAMKMENIVCVEIKRLAVSIRFNQNPGDYCQKIMQGKHLTHANGDYYYELSF